VSLTSSVNSIDTGSKVQTLTDVQEPCITW
jgi:hypothetical protein